MFHLKNVHAATQFLVLVSFPQKNQTKTIKQTKLHQQEKTSKQNPPTLPVLSSGSFRKKCRGADDFSQVVWTDGPGAIGI